MQISFDPSVEELLWVKDDVGIFSFNTWTNRMIQPVHFVVAEQMQAFAIIQKTVYCV